MDFYNETGKPYQVRGLVLSLLSIPNDNSGLSFRLHLSLQQPILERLLNLTRLVSRSTLPDISLML